MKIKREQLLNDLNMVKAGLSVREYIEQSTCLVFQEGEVITFNDEVCCRKDIKLNVKGAVQASVLFSILEKMDDEELEVSDGENGELVFSGKRKEFGIVREADIFLPIERVEKPKVWKPLPKEFTEAISLVMQCVSSDDSRFLLTCVHLCPDWVEACDNTQMMRVRVKTGLERSALVRGLSLASMSNLAMVEISVTKSWVHFKNGDGLIYSCRMYDEEYPSLDALLEVKGHKISIPRGLSEASDRAAVFADRLGEKLITVLLKDGRMKMRGESVLGWYREIKKVKYIGPPLTFVVSAHLLKHISENYSRARITLERLKVSGGQWEYVTALGKKESKSKKEPKE